MASCVHVQWLRLHQDREDFALQYGSRLESICKSIPRPLSQYPSLMFFMGGKSKSAALRAVFPESRISGCRNNGIANLCTDPTSINDKHPVLLADSFSDYKKKTQGANGDNCHETINYPVVWPSGETKTIGQEGLVAYVNARLLSLFIDVLCIFAEDCGGIDGVVKKLAVWASIGSASSLPSTVRPRLIIVTNVPGDAFDSQALRLRLQLRSIPQFSQSFSSLAVVNVLRGTRFTAKLRYSALKRMLGEDAQIARLERINTQTLFSMVHIAAFFEKALQHFTMSVHESFKFINRSRDENPVTVEFENNLSSFLELCTVKRIPDTVTLKFIASAILLDSYPPDMHLFNPSDVFRALYMPPCLLGLRDFANSRQLLSRAICTDIEAQMVALFTQMDSQPASSIRRQSLEPDYQHWALLKTNQFCLFCLRRKPEHVLECGHSICEACVCIFGAPTRGKEYYFDYESCSLCQKRVCFHGRILPPTCRIRFISFDGGGSRAVIPIKFIGALERALGLTYPVQENFDFSIGTSSGGLVNLALFVKYWDVDTCLAFFKRFARQVFPSKLGTRRSIWTTVQRFFASYLADGQYDATVLEEVLQEAFGLQPLFDSMKSRTSGMKVAVTATTISDATLCLFSNYNGVGSYSKDFRYKHLRASKVGDEVLLWEAARCITAAPSFFRPKRLHMFGTFQDGAMRYNSPVRPGLREIRRVWKDGDCDLVLSIGTGYQQQLTSPKAPNVRNVFRDGFLSRFYRASMASLSLNGQNSWKDHWYGLEGETKERQFRLDLPLIGKEPEIDDVDEMEGLEEQVQHHLADVESVARALNAASFFFELDEPLSRSDKAFTCRGFILSRSPDTLGLIKMLDIKYPYARLETSNGSSLGYISANDICHDCGRFQRAITIHVRHPSDVVNIFLVFNRLFRRSISGFPNSMKWFEDRQMFNARFGRSDHKTQSRQLLDSDCACLRRRHDTKSSITPAGKRPVDWGTRRRSKRLRM